jgi:polyphosphate kinase 2 (PPK2 family)
MGSAVASATHRSNDTGIRQIGDLMKVIRKLITPRGAAGQEGPAEGSQHDVTGRIQSKAGSRDAPGAGPERLSEQQARLYSNDTYSLLLIFQAMDAAGKDGTIRHVMSGVNPQGCQVYSFKAPSGEERDHTYLWRSMKALPERGRIGVHNRSHYEEVLAVRVRQEILAAEQFPNR